MIPLVPNPTSGGPTPIIGKSGGFRKTLSFGLTCLVYYATELFCRRNFNLKSDPLGKTFGQMVGAARSAKQNIVEGSARAGTSRETELRLYDVAKGSLAELAGDYEDFLIARGEVPWYICFGRRILYHKRHLGGCSPGLGDGLGLPHAWPALYPLWGVGHTGPSPSMDGASLPSARPQREGRQSLDLLRPWGLETGARASQGFIPRALGPPDSSDGVETLGS